MKLFLALVFVAGSYLGFLFYTSNIVLKQASDLNKTYQYVANNADGIAAGSKPVSSAQHTMNKDQQAVLQRY